MNKIPPSEAFEPAFPVPKWMPEQVVEYTEVQKVMKPSTDSTELKQRLLLDGVVHPANLPSVS